MRLFHCEMVDPLVDIEGMGWWLWMLYGLVTIISRISFCLRILLKNVNHLCCIEFGYV